MMPMNMFLLLDSGIREEIAKEIDKMPRCLCDEWSLSFLSKYPGRDKLLSEDARAELLMLAELMENHTGRMECKFAAVKKSKQAQSTNTWTRSFEDMSAEHVSDVPAPKCRNRWFVSMSN